MPSTCNWVLSRVMQTWLANVQRDFLEQVLVGDLVDKWHQKVQTRHQGAVVLAEPLDDPRVLLGNDLDRLRDKDHRDDEQDDCDFH